MALALLTSCGTSTAPNGPTLPLATYHANNSRIGFSAASSITALNAASLRQRWMLAVSAPISDQTIIDDGVAYWGDWTGHMDATSISGKPLWTASLGTASKPKACPYNLSTQGIVSTPTVATINGHNLVWVGGGAGNWSHSTPRPERSFGQRRSGCPRNTSPGPHRSLQREHLRGGGIIQRLPGRRWKLFSTRCRHGRHSRSQPPLGDSKLYRSRSLVITSRGIKPASRFTSQRAMQLQSPIHPGCAN
jgi:hypothetical protein